MEGGGGSVIEPLERDISNGCIAYRASPIGTLSDTVQPMYVRVYVCALNTVKLGTMDVSAHVLMPVPHLCMSSCRLYVSYTDYAQQQCRARVERQTVNMVKGETVQCMQCVLQVMQYCSRQGRTNDNYALTAHRFR